MNGNLKTVLQVLFLIALIWLLGALIGLAPGAEIRIGSKTRPKWRGRCTYNPFRFVSDGMVGELVQSPSFNPPAVGWPGTVF